MGRKGDRRAGKAEKAGKGSKKQAVGAGGIGKGEGVVVSGRNWRGKGPGAPERPKRLERAPRAGHCLDTHGKSRGINLVILAVRMVFCNAFALTADASPIGRPADFSA